MRGVITSLGDRLLERLVPKTKATAYQGSAAIPAAGYRRCYCGDIGSPPPGSSYPCSWIEKYCDNSGSCTPCFFIGGNCCV
ncbi:hypothetical protein [Flindersiella endophytica]